ncbi:hypothetical protein T12_12770 [Trichinella patagoniensis]|uniref:Uncharacterized protein n=1 Tax=Trichinella patagoniensis TaxID=990121 RepID=A0A0V0ZRG7_9BILA|nr:hypothetical protein T12_12770 [Trichinella patagoniensis]
MIVAKSCCFTCQSISALAANCQGSLKLVYDSSRQMSLVQCAITQSIYIHRSFSLAPKRFVRSAIMLWYLSVAGSNCTGPGERDTPSNLPHDNNNYA